MWSLPLLASVEKYSPSSRGAVTSITTFRTLWPKVLSMDSSAALDAFLSVELPAPEALGAIANAKAKAKAKADAMRCFALIIVLLCFQSVVLQLFQKVSLSALPLQGRGIDLDKSFLIKSLCFSVMYLRLGAEKVNDLDCGQSQIDCIFIRSSSNVCGERALSLILER